MWGGGGEGVRGWPDPEERCTRTPGSGSGHTSPGGKAKGAGGLDSKSMEVFIKYVNWYGMCKLGSGTLLCLALKRKIKSWLTHSP
jgi:hypothetical protein